MGGRKNKTKDNKKQAEAAEEGQPNEEAQMEVAKPTEGEKPPQQPQVAAELTEPEQAIIREPLEDPREQTAPAPIPNTDNDVNGLLVELLSASHDAIDGYQQLNKDKVVQGSKVFESNVPKLLAEFAELAGFNEGTKTKLKEYLQRAQQTNFIENLEQLTSKNSSKLKDLVVDETNIDVLVGKIAQFTGTSSKKNLNEQWKRLEESEAFKAYLDSKPKPQMPPGAPEAAELAAATTKLASLESALKSLQSLYTNTSAQLQEVWQHRPGDSEALQSARKEFLDQVKSLPQEVQITVAQAIGETEKGVSADLSQAGRPEAPRVNELAAELDKARKEFKSREDDFEKIINDQRGQLGSKQQELEAAQQSLAQEKAQGEVHEKLSAELKQKLNEVEGKLKLFEEEAQKRGGQEEAESRALAELRMQQQAAEEESKKLKSEIEEKVAENQELKIAASKLTSIQAELDGLRTTNTELSVKIETEKAIVQDLTTRATTAESLVTELRTSVETFEREISGLQEKHAQLKTENARLQGLLANNEASAQQARDLQAQIGARDDQIARLTADHQNEIDGLEQSVKTLRQKIEQLMEEITRVTREKNRLTEENVQLHSDLNQERLRSTSLMASGLSQQNDAHAQEQAAAVLPPNQATTTNAVQLAQISQRDSSQNVAESDPEDLAEPMALEGDIPLQSKYETQAGSNLTIGRLITQEEVRPRKSDWAAKKEDALMERFDSESVQMGLSTLKSENAEYRAKVKDLETSYLTFKSEAEQTASKLRAATEELEQLRLQVQVQTHTTQEDNTLAAQLKAVQVEHVQDLAKLTDAKVALEAKVQELEGELSKLRSENTQLESNLSHQLHKIQSLEDKNKQLEKERDTYKLGQDEQAKVVRDKDEGLEKIKATLEHAPTGMKDLQLKCDVAEKAYEAQKEAYAKLRAKYEDLKKRYGHKSSGASTPGMHHPAGELRSSRQSVDNRIEETEEADADISDQAKIDLNDAAGSNLARPENLTSPAPFDAQKSLVETLLSHFQQLLKRLAISKEDSELYVPVTSSERTSLDGLMLKLSQHWQSQLPKPQPAEETLLVDTEMEGEQQPQSAADVFDAMREEIEMLNEQKASLSIAVEQLLNPSKLLIFKVLGKEGSKPLEEYPTVSMIAMETEKILNGPFSSKLDEIIAGQSATQHQIRTLQNDLAQAREELSQLQLKYEVSERFAEKLRKVVQLLKSPKKKFTDQNPVAILEAAAGITDTPPVNVDVWKGGLATAVAHVIKDLLRRILSMVPQLHTANPKRNAPWINHVLDLMDGVAYETDRLVDGFRQQGNPDGLEAFLKHLQEVVCKAGEAASQAHTRG